VCITTNQPDTKSNPNPNPNAWIPALRFRSSVQMGLSSIFFRIRSVRDAYTARKRQRRYGTALRTRITETVTNERKRKWKRGITLLLNSTQ